MPRVSRVSIASRPRRSGSEARG